MAGKENRLTRPELALVGTAAMLVFSRVFGLSLVLPNFRGHFDGVFGVFGVSALWIGTAFGAYGLTMALMQIPWGTLSDRIGRRPVLLMASLLFVAGSVWAAFAGDIWSLIAARLMQGLGAVSSVAMATVGESVPPQRRTIAMALIGIPAGGGFMLGMMAGPSLYPWIGMQGLFLVTAAVGGLAALPLLRSSFAAPVAGPDLPPASKEGPESPPAPARSRNPFASLDMAVLGLALAGFVSNYLLISTLFFLPSDDWRALLPSLGVALVVMLLVTRMIDKSRLTWQPVAAGVLLLAVVAPWYAQAAGATIVIAGAAFFSLHAIMSAVLPSQVSRLAGRRGGIRHGIQNITAYGGTFVAGPVAGYFAATVWPTFAVAAGAALLVVVLVVATQRGVAAPRPVPDLD